MHAVALKALFTPEIPDSAAEYSTISLDNQCYGNGCKSLTNPASESDSLNADAC